VELVDANVLDGQVIEDMQSAFCDVPVARDGDDEWTGWCGSALFGNGLADAVERLEDMLEAAVLVRPW